MAAKYDFKTIHEVQRKDEPPTLYPQIVTTGTKDLKALAKELSKRTSLHEGTIIGLFCDLEDLVAEYLADGYNVKLGELGTLSSTLTCRKVTDKKTIRAASVHFDSVKFKPTRQLCKTIRSREKLERAEYGFLSSSTRYSEEERFALLTAHLEKHSVITRKEYSELTGLLRTRASEELRRWSNEKRIVREGRAPHVIYKKMPQEV
ncbi:MAG: DNA-binding protein [Phocaeicola sp.]|uniref:HU family DNA-binding protein n=1 Tax=Phocaeicola sp. TaxID=2773926 RepID=UPI0023C25606|nr:HU family DNA-binding protein [Phocaeicola sp.]MDE5677696.1 DNA-binding protein [Phocaeicola sp.]MDE6180941.1 DNA-binding protein [Phocaeicola sp.]